MIRPNIYNYLLTVSSKLNSFWLLPLSNRKITKIFGSKTVEKITIIIAAVIAFGLSV